jgi:hypothetical protein
MSFKSGAGGGRPIISREYSFRRDPASPDLAHVLEHVPKQLLDFFDRDVLQLLEFERFLFDPVISRDQEAL